MKTCPKCRKRIDVQAVKCPYCQTDFDLTEMNAGRTESRRRFWLSLGAVLAILYAIGYYVLSPEGITRRAEADAAREFESAKH